MRIVALGTLALLIGCSSPADGGLFGNGDAGGSSSGGSSSSGASGSGGSTSGGSSSSGASGNGGSTSGGASSSGASGSGGSSSGSTGTLADAGADANAGIRCFGEPAKFCPLTSVCCITTSEAAGICGDAPACTNAGGAPFACANQSNCATGNVCCAGWNAATAKYTGASCAASCDLAAGTSRRLCGPGAKPDECAAIGLACKKPVNGYAYCQ